MYLKFILFGLMTMTLSLSYAQDGVSILSKNYIDSKLDIPSDGKLDRKENQKITRSRISVKKKLTIESPNLILKSSFIECDELVLTKSIVIKIKDDARLNFKKLSQGNGIDITFKLSRKRAKSKIYITAPESDFFKSLKIDGNITVIYNKPTP